MNRAADLILAVPAAPLVGGVVAGLAVLVRLTSPGPAFFRQRRVGRGRRQFTLYKLRTMVPGAERLGAEVTAGEDPRITSFGRILRRSKLDELPQLFNVLIGDMSLVGPRPETEAFVADYEPGWEEIFSVRPGVTDTASLVFRDEAEVLARAKDTGRAYREIVVPAKIEIALASIRSSSLRQDLITLFNTIGVLLGIVDLASHPVRRRVEEAIAVQNGER